MWLVEAPGPCEDDHNNASLVSGLASPSLLPPLTPTSLSSRSSHSLSSSPRLEHFCTTTPRSLSNHALHRLAPSSTPASHPTSSSSPQTNPQLSHLYRPHPTRLTSLSRSSARSETRPDPITLHSFPQKSQVARSFLSHSPARASSPARHCLKGSRGGEEDVGTPGELDLAREVR